jgi:hypothetical protein
LQSLPCATPAPNAATSNAGIKIRFVCDFILSPRVVLREKHC